MVEDILGGGGIEDSLDIGHIPKGGKRKYFVESGSIYIQTRQCDEKGKLEKEVWERDSGKGVCEETITLEDAVYISKKRQEELRTESKSKKYTPLDLMRLAKRDEYTGYDGIIFFLYQKKPYYSSKVNEIDPLFGEEYPIDA